ncbi:MAG: hypothetical protein ACK4UO_06720 [Pseudolabrys sp.]
MAKRIAAGAKPRARKLARKKAQKPARTSARKPACAPARGRTAAGRFAPGGRALNRIVFAPRRLARMQYLYECTEDSLAAIADEAETSVATLNRTAAEHEWKRFTPQPRDLSPAQVLAEETRALVQAAATAAPADLDALAARLARGLEEQIAAHETANAQLKSLPQTYRDARRAGHDLVALKQALQDLVLMRSNREAPYVSADDRPADIDARRDALARRIEAFMESRTDEECGLGPDGRRIECA